MFGRGEQERNGLGQRCRCTGLLQGENGHLEYARLHLVEGRLCRIGNFQRGK